MSRSKKPNIVLPDLSKLTKKQLEKLTDEQLDWLTSLTDTGDSLLFITEEEGRVFVGRILKRLRKRMGLTQAEMSERIGYDRPQFLSNVERGTSQIPLDRARDFAEAYEADEKLYPAIIKLLHHGAWDQILSMVEMSGADSPSFDKEVEGWILENK